MDDRPRRQQRRYIVRVRVRDVPAELVIAHAADRLDACGAWTSRIGAHVRIDRFDALSFAAVVHVGL